MKNDNCIICREKARASCRSLLGCAHESDRFRLAIKHFTDLLEQFPDDLEVRWLLNLTHMTLGEYPKEVDPRFRLDLSRFLQSELIGRFRTSAIRGVNRFNEAGGAIMEDFDNDGLLDFAVTSFDPTEAMSFICSKETRHSRTARVEPGVTDQLGGAGKVSLGQTMTTTGFMDTIPARCLAPAA